MAAGGSWDEPVPLPFPASRGAPSPWLVAPPSTSQASTSGSSPQIPITLILKSAPPSSTLRTLGITGAFRDNPGSSLHLEVSRLATFIPSVTLLALCHVSGHSHLFQGSGHRHLRPLSAHHDRKETIPVGIAQRGKTCSENCLNPS